MQAAATRAGRERDSLREQLSDAKQRIASASAAAVAEYAATAGELLAQCAAEYQWMAEQADKHLVNERLLINAWPRAN